jgi:hypothetical protein
MRIYRAISILYFFILLLTSATASPLYFIEKGKNSSTTWVDPLIQQRGTATTGNTNGTSLSIAKPAGVVAGDVMIVNISLGRKNSASNANPSLAGWTLISGAQFDNNKNHRGAVLYRVATADDAAVINYTFSLGAGTSGGAGSIAAFANVDVGGATPFDVTPGAINVSPTVQTDTVIANSITTSMANAGIIMLTQSNDNVSWDNALNSVTAWKTTNPVNLSEITDHAFIGADDRLSVGIAWSLKTEAGQTGNGLVKQSALRNFGAILVALKPISTVTPAPSITSTLSASSGYGTTSTYQITASYHPTSYSATSLPAGMSLDAATGVITIGANTAVGDYAISLSATNATGTGSSSTLNYTVSKKALTISATNVLKCFGTTHTFNTALFTSSGLVPGETISAVDMTSTGALSSAVVGSYSIVPSNATGTNGFLASNYEITYQPTGILSVRPLNSWHGAVNTTWTNTANWCLDGAQVPGAADAAIIYPSNNSPELGDSYSLRDLTINAGASILLKSANNGVTNSLTIFGSLINDDQFTMQANTRVIFGTGAHTISGNAITTFVNLTVNSGSTITLNQTIQVSNNLTLTSGYLETATDKLVTIGNGATVTGASNNSYVRGAVKKIGTNGSANYTFSYPIGKSTVAIYDPVGITFPNVSATDDVTVSYHEAAFNITQKNSNIREVAPEYWNITPGSLVSNASGLNVKLHYKSAGGGNYFTNATNVSYYKVGHYSTATNTWEVAVGLDAAQNSADAGSTLSEGFATANGVTAFSRFTMLEITASVLPVTLTHFSAKTVPGNKVVLNWSTAFEQQNKGFQIEKASLSTQGKFQKIAYVYSKGLNGASSAPLHYSFTESIPQGETYAYFRIIQQDLDGKMSPSEIRLVKFNATTPIDIAVSSSTGKVTITRNADAKKMNFRVTDQLGRIVIEQKGIVDQVFISQLFGNGIFTLYLQIPESREQLIKRVLVQK